MFPFTKFKVPDNVVMGEFRTSAGTGRERAVSQWCDRTRGERGESMRRARVEYETGREVLAAYWGFLGSGGLVLARRSPIMAEVVEGEAIVLHVRIASLRKEYQLAGSIRRLHGGNAVIAFDAGQAQDVMLAAAWADGQGVPERRHRRWDLDVPVRFRTFEREGSGRLVNLSRGGCCLAVDAGTRSGARLFLVGDGFVAEGMVRWSKALDRLLGVEFARFHEDLVDRLVGLRPPAVTDGNDGPALSSEPPAAPLPEPA